MKRINIMLATRQLAALTNHASKLGLSVSEIIRRAIDEYLDKHR